MRLIACMLHGMVWLNLHVIFCYFRFTIINSVEIALRIMDQ